MSANNSELFRPNQIVYLESEPTYLYSEVIQVIDSRQLCWVRPLAIAISNHSIPSQLEVVDLRLTSDLLWPSWQFRPAIDTQVIPLLAQLTTAEMVLADAEQANAYLHGFVTQKSAGAFSGSRFEQAQFWSEQDKV